MNDGPKSRSRLRLLRQTIGYFRYQRSFTPAEVQMQWPHRRNMPTLIEIARRLQFYQKTLGIETLGSNRWRFV